MPKTSRALARGPQKPPRERGLVGGDENIRISRLQKITFAEMRSAGVRGMLIYCAGAADRWPRDEAIGSSCPRKRRQRRRREDLKEHPGEEEEKQHMLPRYASRPFSIACLIPIPESLPRCRVANGGRCVREVPRARVRARRRSRPPSGPNLTLRFALGFLEGLACASLGDAGANEHPIEPSGP